MINENEKLKNEITPLLKSPLEVICFDRLDSTNSEAKRLLKNGKTNNFLIAAAEQTAGRGRQGKSFYSPKGTGIYFSVALNAGGLPDFLSVTTAAAVSVCRAIERLTKKSAQIKWVNDIYIQDKKVCGILTEAQSCGGDISAVIIGIGVNLTTSDFPATVENGGSLGFFGSTAELVAEIADGVYETALLPVGEYIDYYRSRSILTGKQIYIIENDKKTPALALGISDTGALEVRLENGEVKQLSGGDVTIRKKE